MLALVKSAEIRVDEEKLTDVRFRSRKLHWVRLLPERLTRVRSPRLALAVELSWAWVNPREVVLEKSAAKTSVSVKRLPARVALPNRADVRLEEVKSVEVRSRPPRNQAVRSLSLRRKYRSPTPIELKARRNCAFVKPNRVVALKSAPAMLAFRRSVEVRLADLKLTDVRFAESRLADRRF
jgi:hypothetical protein